MYKKNLISIGKTLDENSRVLLMIHGRGGSAEDIMSLASHLNVKDFHVMAPQATNNSWYPYSFMAPVSANEPWLSSTMELLKETVADLETKAVKKENLYLLGFSQGACVALEFAARNAALYGGIVAFTGGLIGEKLDTANYKGNFDSTPIFIGTSDPDPHVPVERVNESALILENMGAVVTKKIYKGMGHTISKDEIDRANELIFH